jgi:hypothetical protein
VIHKLINSVWNKEELPDQWKESIIVPVHKKGDKTDCNNYRQQVREDTQFASQDSNWAPSEYKYKPLPLHQSAQLIGV